MSWLDNIFKILAPVKKKGPAVAVIPASPVVAPVIVEPPKVIAELLDLGQVTFDKSPNQSERGDEVRAIVLHHTGPGSFNGIVSWLKNPIAKVSAHYVLGTQAELTQLVNTSKKALHAGVSSWIIDGAKRNDLNNCTIGIEIQNIGVLSEKGGKYYYEDSNGVLIEWKGGAPFKTSITYPSGKVLEGYAVKYPAVQLDKLVALGKALIVKYPAIGKEDILTHFNISLPEGRKPDPFGLDVADIIRRIFE